MRFSVEFAIRIFAKKYPHETFAQMQQRAKHSNYHVRRLASE
jgi:3-methyladenine DNA glycosylase AlkC